MMKKIDEIWENLEKTDFSSHPLLFRGYSGFIRADIFVALKFPEKFRCIAIHLDAGHSFELESWENFRDLKLDSYPDLSDPSKKYFLIVLLNNNLKEIFSALSEDFFTSLGHISDESLLVKEILIRLEKWAALFSRALGPGLSPEEQMGLYGELYFLRLWLQQSVNKGKCLQAWSGPEKSVKDFQYGNWALEAKATKGNNHQKVHISSERQLDSSSLDNLILFHISLDVLKESGESLNILADSIYDLLTDDFHLFTIFQLKLIEAGYYQEHKQIYESKGYHVRQKSYYEVRDDFPRIQENEVRNGVGDIKYSIILNNCTSFLLNESEIFKIIS